MGSYHLICHDYTKLSEHGQGLPPYDSINRKNIWRKVFPLIVTVLTMLVFLDSLPSIQEHCHWIILVGIRTRISKFDIDYGFILLIL